MNAITAADLQKKKREIYKKNSVVPIPPPAPVLSQQDNFNDEESHVCEKPLRSVSDMNTFKRKLDNSLRQTILPQHYENQAMGRMQTAAEKPRRYESPFTNSTQPTASKSLSRKDTLFEKPVTQSAENLDFVFSPTRPTVRRRSQSNVSAQTDKLAINMDDMYSIFEISKKEQNKCKNSAIKCFLLTTGITAYTIGLLAFQYYVLSNRN